MASRNGWKVTPDMRVSWSTGNRKTGRMLVSRTSGVSCPPGCPFFGKGCYAETSQTGTQVWREISTGQSGVTWSDFCAVVASKKPDTLWRMNESGDLPGIGDKIDPDMLGALVDANSDKRGFTYTHKPVLSGSDSEANRKMISGANRSGFTVNLSADSLAHADRLLDLDIGPVAVVLPSDAPRRLKTPKGVRIVSCPAENSDKTCRTCGLCQKANRTFVIGLHAHGIRKRMVSEIVG